MKWFRRYMGLCEECGGTLNEHGVCLVVAKQRAAWDARFAEFVRTGEKWRKPIATRP